MKKTTTLLLALSLFFVTTTAQNPVNDLLKKIETTSEPRAKVDLLEDLNLLWSLYDTTKGAVLMERDAQTMLKLAESANYRRGIGNAYRALGMQQSKNKKFEEALIFYNKAFPFYEASADHADLTLNYIRIAKTYALLNNIDTSLILSQKAIAMAEKGHSEKDKFNQARIYAIYAGNFFQKGMYEDALKWMLKALKIYDDLGEKGEFEKANVYLNIAQLNSELHNDAAFLDYSQKALAFGKKLNIQRQTAFALEYLGGYYRKIGQNDSAMYYLEQSLLIPIADKTDVYNNIGLIYEKKKDYVHAIEAYQKGYDAAIKENNPYGQAALLNNIGYNYFLLKKYPQAIPFLEKSYKLALTLDAPTLVTDIIGSLGETYLAAGQHKLGGDYLLKYKLRLDSLSPKEIEEAVAESQEKYKSEKKENENLQLKLTNDRKNTALYAIGALTLLVGGFGWGLRQQNKKLAITNQLIAERNATIDALKSEAQHRNASQIHALQNAIEQYSSLETGTNTPIQDLKSRINAITELFNLLEFSNQKTVNIKHYLTNILEKIATLYPHFTQIGTMRMDIPDDIIVESLHKALPIGRVCTELVTNALKYAFMPQSTGGKILVTLKSVDDTYQLMVSDNGHGLKHPLSILVKNKPSGGLSIAKDLTETLSGRFETVSDAATGTQHIAIFPK